MIFKVPAVKIAVVVATLNIATLQAKQQNNEDLLRTRETVWRAWFAGDATTLRKLVPLETIVISAGEKKWKKQSEVLQEAVDFHAAGGKLISLQFPRTEVQHFGNVAIVWSTYELETEVGGKRSPDSGRVTEIFVRRHGHWTNPGWHTDSTR